MKKLLKDLIELDPALFSDELQKVKPDEQLACLKILKVKELAKLCPWFSTPVLEEFGQWEPWRSLSIVIIKQV